MTSFDYQTATPGQITATNVAAVAAQWIANVGADYLACLSNLALAQAVIVQVMSSPSVPSFNSAWSGPGTGGASQLPIEVAAVVSKYSTLKGQHGRGRSMMPSVPVNFTLPATNPNELIPAGVAAYNFLFTTVLAGLTVGAVALSPAIFTRPIKPAVLVTRAVHVTSYRIQTILGTIRRRREGRGI